MNQFTTKFLSVSSGLLMELFLLCMRHRPFHSSWAGLEIIVVFSYGAVHLKDSLFAFCSNLFILFIIINC